MKKFNYESDYKKFKTGDEVYITFVENKKNITQKVRILSINTKHIAFEDEENIYECTSEETICIKKVSIFDKAVAVLTFTGYGLFVLIFYGLFGWVLLASMCQSFIGILFSLFYFYFIVISPYIYIFKKKKDSTMMAVSNFLTFVLAFHLPVYAASHVHHETLGVEFLAIFLALLLFFWPMHNLLMSLGRALFSIQSRKHSPFWSVFLFILLLLLGIYVLNL